MPRVFPKPATYLNFLHSKDDLPPDNKTQNEPRDKSSRVSEPISIFKICRQHILHHSEDDVPSKPQKLQTNQEMYLAVSATPLNTITTTPIFPSHVCNATQHYNDHPNLSSQTLPDTHETCNVEIYWKPQVS